MDDTYDYVAVGRPRFIVPDEIFTLTTLEKFHGYTDFDKLVYDCRKKLQRIIYVVQRLETCNIKLTMKGGISTRRAIFELQDGDSMASTTEDIVEMATNFWKKQYEDLGDSPDSGYLDLPVIDEESAQRLDSPFTQDELFSCLQSKSDSAPGEDGLTFKFWQSTWHMYGEMLTKTANGLMEGVIPSSMTKILLTMVPKSLSLIHVKNFQPIALINTSLRLICQAINERLLLVADQLIGPYQTGFLKDRHIHDNILLFQSVLHCWRKCENDHPWVVLNDPDDLAAVVIKFENAFDLINQTYIGNCLEKAGIPPRLGKAIMTILRTQHAQVYINNVKGPSFPMRRGTMQGNPFSPFLSILGMEQLLRNLSKIRGMSLQGRHRFDSTELKVMAYTDKLMVFMRKEDRPIVQDCLSEFAFHSGYKVNVDRSLILVKEKGDNPDRCHHLGFPITTVAELSKIRYLEVRVGDLDWKKEHRKLLKVINDCPQVLPSRLGHAINALLPSKLYIRDIHSPMSKEEITSLMDAICKQKFSGIDPETVFTKSQLGGFGVLRLDRQLLGRRAQVVHEAIFGNAWHHRLFRLTIQHWVTWTIHQRQSLDDNYETVPWYHILLGKSIITPSMPYNFQTPTFQQLFSKLIWACILAWIELTGVQHSGPIIPTIHRKDEFEKLVEPYVGEHFKYDPEIFHSVSKKSIQINQLLRKLDLILRPSDRNRLPKFWKQMSKQLHVLNQPYDYLHMFHIGADVMTIQQARKCLLCGCATKTFIHTFFQCRIACQVWRYAGLRGIPQISKLVGVCGQPQDKYCSYMRRLLRDRTHNHKEKLTDIELRPLLRDYETLYRKEY